MALLALAHDVHRAVARCDRGDAEPDRPAVADLLGRIARLQEQVTEPGLEGLRQWLWSLRRQVEGLGRGEP